MASAKAVEHIQTHKHPLQWTFYIVFLFTFKQAGKSRCVYRMAHEEPCRREPVLPTSYSIERIPVELTRSTERGMAEKDNVGRIKRIWLPVSQPNRALNDLQYSQTNTHRWLYFFFLNSTMANFRRSLLNSLLVRLFSRV